MRGLSNAETKLFSIKKGKAGIIQTLRIMGNIVNKYKTDIAIRELAQNIIEPVKEKDWFNEAKIIQNWVRDNIRYTRDVAGVETIATPDHTLHTGHGDCDDQAIVVATLLESIGHPTRFVAVGPMKGIYNHVYTEVLVNGDWLPVETTEDWKIGKGPPVVRSKIILNNRSKKTLGQVAGQSMQNFKDTEEELDAELDAILLIPTLQQAGFTLDEYYSGLNGMGEMHGFFKRLKKSHKKRKKKFKKVIKKVAKVVAVAAAVYFTAGAALGPMLALANQKKQAKALQQAAEEENLEIERQNKIVEAQQAAYDKEMAMASKAEADAISMLKKNGIKVGSPQAKAYLRKSIKLESDKLAAGISPVETSTKKKVLTVAAVGVPLLAALALA